MPLASAWRPGAVAWGIAATYLLVAIQVTSCDNAPVARASSWHAVHLMSFPLFAAATVHGFTAGRRQREPRWCSGSRSPADCSCSSSACSGCCPLAAGRAPREEAALRSGSFDQGRRAWRSRWCCSVPGTRCRTVIARARRHSSRAGGRTMLVDAGRGVCMRLVGRRRVAVHARRGAAHASAQRSHLRSERRDHHAMGDEPGAEVVAGVRAAAHARSRGRHARDAAARRRVPARPSRRSRLGAAARCRRGHAGHRVRRGRHARRRRRATDHRPVEPTIGFRIECEGKAVVLAGDTVPCEGLDELCAGRGRLRADGVARRPRAGWCRCSASSTRSTITRPWRRPRRPRRGAACARSCSRTRCPHQRWAPPTSGSPSRATTSTARSCSART